MRRARAFFLTLFSILAVIAAASALHAAPGVVPARVNPAFVRYLRDLRDGTADGRAAPKAYLTPDTAAPRARAARRAQPTQPKTPLPVSYDLAEHGWVTGIKDQRGWGTCWDFATMEAIESNLKKTTGAEYALSELHLGFFAYYPESPELPAFDKSAKEGANPIFDSGGNAAMSRAMLSRGTGPVLESDAPYPQADPYDRAFWAAYPEDPEALRGELLRAKPAFRLKESLTFQEPDDIKRALMEYGGLWVSMNTKSIVSRDHPYLYTTEPGVTHMVLLTGWDDTLSGDLFNDYRTTGESADLDGAWRIQNSWGVSIDRNGEKIAVGDGGYFWVSYADRSIFGGEAANSFVAMPADSYQHTYAHDPLGVYYVLDAYEEAVTANVFTSARDEEIVRVGFDTEGRDIGYGIQVYRDIPANGMPDEGTPVFDAPQTGTADFPGYRTVELAAPVPLGKGERFAVAVTFSSEGGDIQIPVEARIDGITSAAAAKPNESFIQNDEEWIEVRTISFDVTVEGSVSTANCTNLTIKAFTNSAERGRGSSGGCAAAMSAPLLAALIPLARRRK